MSIRFSTTEIKIGNKKLSFIFVVLFLIYLSGCSVSHNYKTLSFFFDGVPDPSKGVFSQSSDTVKSSDTTLIAQNLNRNTPVMIVHPPYKDKQCASCHDQSKMGKLNQSMPDVCYQCHDNFSDKYKVLHGPVGGGQCTTCHNPHMSENKNLLVRTGQLLCLFCHNTEQVMQAVAHKDIKDVSCTECHNPHGGQDRYVLR